MEVRGYPNYLIYPDGRVWSKKSKKFLKLQMDHNGYNRVSIYRKGKSTATIIKVHRLVAEHYISNPYNKKCVDHINGCRYDNRLENLRWAKYEENGQNRKSHNKNNRTGYKNINKQKRGNTYRYVKDIKGKRYEKEFKTLKEALCYKYIFTLKIRAGLL